MQRKTDTDYLTSICQQFVDIYPRDYARAAAVIEEEGDALEAIRDSLRTVGAELYDASGYTKEYKAYETVSSRLSSLCSSVAHLNGDAFVPDQLVEDFLAGQLPFQR